MSGAVSATGAIGKMPASERELIDDFCDQVWLQDGLAPSSLASYRQDLGQWAGWLAPQGKSMTAPSHVESFNLFAIQPPDVSGRPGCVRIS